MIVKMKVQKLEKVISECIVEREIPDECIESVDGQWHRMFESEYAINDEYLDYIDDNTEQFSDNSNFKEVRREEICYPQIKTISELNGKIMNDREEIDVNLVFDD